MFKMPFLKKKETNSYKSYILFSNNIISKDYNNPELAIEGFMKNVAVYSIITLIVDQIKRLKFELYEMKNNGSKKEIVKHPLLDLLKKPYPTMSQVDFLEQLFIQFEIYGNGYIQKIFKADKTPERYKKEIPILVYPLRPDEISSQEGDNHFNHSYTYAPSHGRSVVFQVTPLGQSNLITLKNYNPNSDYRGMSKLLPAGYSVDVHNEINKCQLGLLLNGAKPSGILTVPAETVLTQDQIDRIRAQIEEKTNGNNSGKPLVLEGGMTWTQISFSPVDIGYNDMKKQAVHEIAMAYGVPLELANQEQSKYENKMAAYKQLYENTVIPTTNKLIDALNAELVPLYGDNLELVASFDHTRIMKELMIWTMKELNDINFITPNEKRFIIGYEDIDGGDTLQIAKKEDPINSDLKAKFIAEQASDGVEVNEAVAIGKLIYG